MDPDAKIGGPDAPYRKESKPRAAEAIQRAVKREIVVQVAREFDGALYSRVINKADVNHWNGEPAEIVIDRKTRVLDQRIIRRRAELLAQMIGVPFEEDLRWPCSANRKIACRCPKCIEEGRA